MIISGIIPSGTPGMTDTRYITLYHLYYFISYYIISHIVISYLPPLVAQLAVSRDAREVRVAHVNAGGEVLRLKLLLLLLYYHDYDYYYYYDINDVARDAREVRVAQVDAGGEVLRFYNYYYYYYYYYYYINDIAIDIIMK
jgi:hypothetical protein